MGKQESQPHIIPGKGELVIPFEPFYGHPLSIGTRCDIMKKLEDEYIVSFLAAGYAGTMRIKKRFIKENV